MTTLPITVLVYEGPTSRACLSCLKRAGFRPAKILLIVLNKHPSNGRKIGGYLPLFLRKVYAQKIQETSMNYWPRFIWKNVPRLADAMIKTIEQTYGYKKDLFEEILGKFTYENYAEEVEKVFVSGIKSKKLREALERQKYKTVLFTGGGIMPAPVFSIPEIKILHLHPGKLPEIRGADGTLWSVLVRGRPGISCFYMEAGLDTGDIIKSEDLGPLKFDIRKMKRPDDDMLYRALFSFYDPVLRTDFLLKVITENQGIPLGKLPALKQNKEDGTAYRFMDEHQRKEALEKIFISQVRAT